MKTSIFFLVIGMASLGRIDATLEDKIINKITAFSSMPATRKPYHQLTSFFCHPAHTNQDTVKKIAAALEIAYKKRKDEISNSQWSDFVPYSISRCLVITLQHGANPSEFKMWGTIAGAISKYCTDKTCSMTANEIKDYYLLRYAPKKEGELHFSICKKQAQQSFLKNGKVAEEKKELLNKFRAYALLSKDGRMKKLLDTRTLMAQQ